MDDDNKIYLRNNYKFFKLIFNSLMLSSFCWILVVLLSPPAMKIFLWVRTHDQDGVSFLSRKFLCGSTLGASKYNHDMIYKLFISLTI